MLDDSIDLIPLDVNMPELTGFDVVRQKLRVGRICGRSGRDGDRAPPMTDWLPSRQAQTIFEQCAAGPNGTEKLDRVQLVNQTFSG